jgi:hypothetical protein
MTPSKPIKLVAGTLTAAIALSAGAALASDSGDPEPDLKDVVLIRDIDPPEWTPASFTLTQADADDSIASPFESADESPDDSVESASVESADESPDDSVESASVESADESPDDV